MRHSKLVGAVSNCAVSTYPGTYAVRLKTAPTRGESVHLFLESTIVGLLSVKFDFIQHAMTSVFGRGSVIHIDPPLMLRLDEQMSKVEPVQGLHQVDLQIC